MDKHAFARKDRGGRHMSDKGDRKAVSPGTIERDPTLFQSGLKILAIWILASVPGRMIIV